MKNQFLPKNTLLTKLSKKKPLLYILLAAGSFLLLVFFCVRLKADGVAPLICLILHTCALLLLYRDALIALDPEEWETERKWMEVDLPPEEIPEAPVLYNNHIYAEVRESFIEVPATKNLEFSADATKTMDNNIADETDAPMTENVEISADASAAESASETALDTPAELPADTTQPTDDAEAVSIKVSEADTPTSETDSATNPDTLEPESPAIPSLPAISKKRVQMDLIAAAQDAIQSLSSFAAAQKIKLQLSSPCDTLPMQADPESIRTLFRNIIDNSIKYMGRPGHLIFTISLLGDDIFLILKDTGNGLDAEETRHVFELNFQGSNRVSGNGLGLTQAKMIVEAFGGTIYAKSSPGNGMAIYIQLPLSGGAQS